MATSADQPSTLMGTASGTILSLAFTINSGDVLKTTVLAAIGACVSFLVSILLKRITRFFRRK